MGKKESMRIEDNLDASSKLLRKPHFVNHDSLSIKVFDSDLIPAKVNKFYINTSFDPIDPSDRFENEIFTNLGYFERQLLSKLLKPVRKILFVCGEAGCGKTTTINYLNNLIKNLPENNNLFDVFLPIIINLNNKKYSENDEAEAGKLLYEEICTNLRGLINLHHLISLETELIDFWNCYFDKARGNVSGYEVFIWIAKILGNTDNLSKQNPNFKPLLASRKSVLSDLKKNNFYYFNYLLHLWGYIFETLEVKSCSYIIFDNIDKASLVVQSTLLSIVDDASSDPGPSIVVSLRPETFSSLNIQNFRNSRVVDTINHPGISPSVVIKDRLDRFINNPTTFYDKDDGLSDDQFKSLIDFMIIIQDIYNSGQGYKHKIFLNAACSRSLRQALILAQKYFKISDLEFNDGKLSAHTLNRIVVVNHGDEVRDEKNRYFIPNIFELKELNSTARLIKLRILNYLNRKPDQIENQINIRMEMKGFGYSETKVVKLALSDLLHYSSNLLSTNGLESYNSDIEFLRSGKDKIELTKKGVGYIDNIIYNLDFIQEIMLDCYMPSQWVDRQLRFSNIPEKFSLLLSFLKYLYDIDLNETENFIIHFDIDHFREFHGDSLITIPLIVNSCNAIHHIFSSILVSGDSSSIKNYEAPLQSASLLLYNALKDNENLIGFKNKIIKDTRDLILDSVITNFPQRK